MGNLLSATSILKPVLLYKCRKTSTPVSQDFRRVGDLYLAHEVIVRFVIGRGIERGGGDVW